MRQQKSQLVSGTIIVNRYRILEPLNLGLNGEFYRSHTLEELPRYCSIERLDLGVAVSTSAMTRIRRIIQGVDRINHPNLAPVVAIECLSDRSIVLVREDLVGQSLASAIREDGAWSWRRAMAVGLQISQGLKVLHQCGHYHGSLRLDHILREHPNGVEEQIKVIDLGFARIINQLRDRVLQVVRNPRLSLSPAPSRVSSHIHFQGQFPRKSASNTEDPLLQAPRQLKRVPTNSVIEESGEQLDIRCLGDLMYTLISGKPVRSSGTNFSPSTSIVSGSVRIENDSAIADSSKVGRNLPKLSELELPVAVERVIYRCWQNRNEAGFADISALMNEMRDALELDSCRARAEATTRPESLPTSFERKIRAPRH